MGFSTLAIGTRCIPFKGDNKKNGRSQPANRQQGVRRCKRPASRMVADRHDLLGSIEHVCALLGNAKQNKKRLVAYAKERLFWARFRHDEACRVSIGGGVE
jgi:hypothetical protein